jgi:hypothetical protein
MDVPVEKIILATLHFLPMLSKNMKERYSIFDIAARKINKTKIR